MAKRRPLAPLFVIALCAAAVWLYFTPYLAMNRLQKAAEQGDTEALNELVDFPAFRESVKQGVSTAVARQIDDESNPLARLGGWIAGRLSSPLVDTFVSPEGIAALSRGERPGDDSADRAGDDGVRAPDVKIRRGYDGFDRFVVHFHDREDGQEKVALVWKREGIAGWRLTGIRLPPDAEDAAE